jgi:hypothetical protein
LIVLTEAATGHYCYTPLVAALAGADRVLALTRDSRYGSAQSVKEQTDALARVWGVEDRVDVVFDRGDHRLGTADVVTNLGFVRPLDEPFLRRLPGACSISLMWETWEYRPEELDLEACRKLGIAVLGTNEHHGSLHTLRYTGAIAAKLLLALEIELFRAAVVVVGGGEFARDVMDRLAAWGAYPTFIASEQLGPAHLDSLARAEALVVAEPSHRDILIGPGGLLEPAQVAHCNPALAIAHICGGVDRQALVDLGLACAPPRFAAPPHMSVATDYLGPRPVIELHAAGLAVGAALARQRRAGRSAAEAEAQVLAECPLAQGFGEAPPREFVSPALLKHSPRQAPGAGKGDVCLTLDVDWAPDHAIDWVADLLIDHAVKATWFVTHNSPAVDRLRAQPKLFELGIHPNFLAGSTHGTTVDQVLDHCLELVPEARSMRTHGLWQSTLLFQKVLERKSNIRADVSLLAFGAAGLSPFLHRYRGHSLWRIPYQWEDTFAMEAQAFPERPLEWAGGGLKIFSFHPIHVVLNATTMGNYQRLKQAVPCLSEAGAAALAPYQEKGTGMRQRFIELVEHLARDGSGQRIDDIVSRMSPTPPEKKE